MDIIFLERGLFIGLIFGVPAGAIGALTIQRALERGFMAGFITGLGSSAADVLYACVGVFGITLISDFLIAQQALIRFIGGVLVITLGVIISKQPTRLTAVNNKGKHPALWFFSSFSIAMLNPATILSFLIAFTAFGITGILNIGQGIGLILGILLGTAFWWSLISGMVARFRNHVTDKTYRLLNGILGCFMIGFGVLLIGQGVFVYFPGKQSLYP